MPVLNKLNDSDQSSEEPKKFTPASYFPYSHDKSSTVQSGNQSNPPPNTYLANFFNRTPPVRCDNQLKPTSPSSNTNAFTEPKDLTRIKIIRSNIHSGTHLIPSPGLYKPTNTFADTKINGNDSKRNFPETKKLKPALVYIFNHENFDTMNEPRRGSAQDEAALVKTFDQLKCEVQVIKDGTVAKIKSTVQILESKSFEEQSALVIVILTHGGRHDMLAAKDSDYSLDDVVIFPILRNQTLMNKPKLVFVQACKGDIKLDSLKTDNVQHGSPNNILKCYSTFEGYVAYRDENNGTPYIQILCEALQKSGRTKDIMAIVMEVGSAVQENTKDRQIPSFLSTMSSKYVFGDYM